VNLEQFNSSDEVQHHSKILEAPRTTNRVNGEKIRVAAILPAYNESGRIGNVLAVLRNVNLVQEIIVVDDGSQDTTAEEAALAASNDVRIRLIRHQHNMGKGAAMFTGSRRTNAPILIFLDSDLINLAPNQVEDLIRPVANGLADMTIGVFQQGSFFTDLSQHITPWLSGQRCMKHHLLQQISYRAAAGYGVETAITITARQNKWRVASVPLIGVSHPTGEIHRGLFHGAANRLRMYGHILQAAWLTEAPQFQFARLTPRIRYISLVMTIIFAITLAFNQAQALALIDLEDLASINIEGVFRVLVVDSETSSIPDLLTAESNDQKLLNLPQLDFNTLKLPLLDIPFLEELPNQFEKPELIQGVALSLTDVQLDSVENRLKLRLTGDPDPDAVYQLLVVTSSGETQNIQLTLKGKGHGQISATSIIDLDNLGEPFLIGIALEADLNGDTQRSGWTLILFPEWIPKQINPAESTLVSHEI